MLLICSHFQTNQRFVTVNHRLLLNLFHLLFSSLVCNHTTNEISLPVKYTPSSSHFAILCRLYVLLGLPLGYELIFLLRPVEAAF